MVRLSNLELTRKDIVSLKAMSFIPNPFKTVICPSGAPRMSVISRFSSLVPVALGCLILMTAKAEATTSGVVTAIEKKYAVTEMTADYTQVTKDGTTMAVKCAGIYGMPTGMMMSTPPDNQVIDGKLKPPSGFEKVFLAKLGAHVLQTGDKIYITKIDSREDAKGDILKFSILTVESLDVTGQDAKKKFSASVSFRFKKGYLDDTPPDEVEATVEAVLAPDTGSDQAQSGNSGESQSNAQSAPPQQQQAAAASPPPPPPPAPAAPAAAPPTISVGESSTQVLQSLGMPQQMIDLDKKKIFVYKNLNMKITFVNDKVSDVQ
jgi:hypothetical protein